MLERLAPAKAPLDGPACVVEPDALCHALVRANGGEIRDIEAKVLTCRGAWRTVKRIDDTPIPEAVGRRERTTSIHVVGVLGRHRLGWCYRDHGQTAARALAARLAYQLGVPSPAAGPTRDSRLRGRLSVVWVASARYGDGAHQEVRYEETI